MADENEQETQPYDPPMPVRLKAVIDALEGLRPVDQQRLLHTVMTFYILD